MIEHHAIFMHGHCDRIIIMLLARCYGVAKVYKVLYNIMWYSPSL
jgi:hypothetical protein